MLLSNVKASPPGGSFTGHEMPTCGIASPWCCWVIGSLAGKMTACSFAPVRFTCFADKVCRR